jgi:hypothetical protein
MKIKMVKTALGAQYLLEWWYEFNGHKYLADWKIKNSLR